MSILDCKSISSYVASNLPDTQMTFRRLVSLLKPVFAEDGSNERTYQNKVYNVFLKYLREAGSKYFQYILVNLKEKSNLKTFNN